MKSFTYSILAAALSCGLASAVTTAYTTPVGYVSLGNTTGGNAVAANTDALIAVPLARETEFAGLVSSVDTGAGTITVSGTPAWTSNQWLSVPYCLVVKSGPQSGLMALITANTADTVTLSVTIGNLAAVGVGDAVAISKLWTLGSLLPIANIPNGTQLFLYDGTKSGINIPLSVQYTKATASWLQTQPVGSGSKDNVILYPGESFVLRTGANPVASLVVTGEVPTWNHRTLINKYPAANAGGQDTRLSYFSPVGEQIGSAGIPASNGDQLIVYDNSTAGKNKPVKQILTKTATGWFGTLGPLTGNQNTYLIGGGIGYIYRRVTSAPAGDLDWSDQQSYLPLP